MSAFTQKSVVENLNGQQLKRDVHYTGPTSYDTNGSGVPYTLRALGLRTIRSVSVEVESATYSARYERATDKIVVYTRSTAAEVANATDLSAESFRLTASGT